MEYNAFPGCEKHSQDFDGKKEAHILHIAFAFVRWIFAHTIQFQLNFDNIRACCVVTAALVDQCRIYVAAAAAFAAFDPCPFN